MHIISELEQRRGSTLAKPKTCGTSKACNCSTELGNRGPDDDRQSGSRKVSLPTATAFICFLEAYPNYNLKASVDAINSDFLLLFIETAQRHSPCWNYDPSDTNTVWLHCRNPTMIEEQIKRSQNRSGWDLPLSVLNRLGHEIPLAHTLLHLRV